MMSIFSLFLSVLCMFCLFNGYARLAQYSFAASLMMLLISLGVCLWEIQISTKALSIQLKDMGDDIKLWDPIKDWVKGKHSRKD